MVSNVTVITKIAPASCSTFISVISLFSSFPYFFSLFISSLTSTLTVLLIFMFGFSLALSCAFTPPSFSPASSLALSFPTLPLFSPTSCKISPCHLSVFLCMDRSHCVLSCQGWVFVWVTMWGCMCYFYKTRGGEGEAEREWGVEAKRRRGTGHGHVDVVLALAL